MVFRNSMISITKSAPAAVGGHIIVVSNKNIIIYYQKVLLLNVDRLSLPTGREQ